MDGNLYGEIAEKRKTLRGIYGGIMSLTDVAKELSVTRGVAGAWVRSKGLGNQIGRRVRHETDMVARAIVQDRGMCA